MTNRKTLEELEAMVEQQDHELEDARGRFEDFTNDHPDARFDVSPAFLADLEETCVRRLPSASPFAFTFSMRA